MFVVCVCARTARFAEVTSFFRVVSLFANKLDAADKLLVVNKCIRIIVAPTPSAPTNKAKALQKSKVYVCVNDDLF